LGASAPASSSPSRTGTITDPTASVGRGPSISAYVGKAPRVDYSQSGDASVEATREGTGGSLARLDERLAGNEAAREQASTQSLLGAAGRAPAGQGGRPDRPDSSLDQTRADGAVDGRLEAQEEAAGAAGRRANEEGIKARQERGELRRARRDIVKEKGKEARLEAKAGADEKSLDRALDAEKDDNMAAAKNEALSSKERQAKRDALIAASGDKSRSRTEADAAKEDERGAEKAKREARREKRKQRNLREASAEDANRARVEAGVQDDLAGDERREAKRVQEDREAISRAKKSQVSDSSEANDAQRAVEQSAKQYKATKGVGNGARAEESKLRNGAASAASNKAQVEEDEKAQVGRKAARRIKDQERRVVDAKKRETREVDKVKDRESQELDAELDAKAAMARDKRKLESTERREGQAHRAAVKERERSEAENAEAVALGAEARAEEGKAESLKSEAKSQRKRADSDAAAADGERSKATRAGQLADEAAAAAKLEKVKAEGAEAEADRVRKDLARDNARLATVQAAEARDEAKVREAEKLGDDAAQEAKASREDQKRARKKVGKDLADFGTSLDAAGRSELASGRKNAKEAEQRSLERARDREQKLNSEAAEAAAGHAADLESREVGDEAKANRKEREAARAKAKAERERSARDAALADLKKFRGSQELDEIKRARATTRPPSDGEIRVRPEGNYVGGGGGDATKRMDYSAPRPGTLPATGDGERGKALAMLKRAEALQLEAKERARSISQRRR
jgi:hypothetical protein